MKPIAFKVRGGGNYSGTKGGAVKPNEKGGAGYLGYEDKTFTIATSPDQWICTTINNLSSQPIPMNEPAQPATVGKRIRYLSVCSGMEAASVAWHPLGWTPVGFSEIEPFPCAILKHRFPNTPNYGSLTEHHTWPIEPGAIDLLVGGTPCQSFSVAGLRKGLADPRGNLALTFLALADKLKPKWIVWENVPGCLSSGQPKGSDFGCFVQGLVELGYGFAYRVLDAQYFGVPQRRRRVFVVACLGDWRAPAEVFSLREGLRGYLEAGGKKRKGPSADAGSGVEAGGPVVIDRAAFNQGVNAQFDPHIAESEVMDSLVARGPHAVGQPIAFSAKDHGGDATVGISPTLRSQNSVEGNQNSSWSIAITQPIPFRKSKRAASTTDNETWVPADVTNTLNNFDLGDTRTTHAVVEPHIVQASELRLRGQITEQKTVPTLLANTKSGDNDPLAVHAITFQPGNLRRKAGAEPSTTTTTTPKASAGDQTPHLAYPAAAAFKSGQGSAARSIGWDENVSPTLPANAGGNTAPAVIGTMTAMAVRRLTPVECERLQGFPDNWSRIPWKGKPETECPDGPRYKACGNSMAVPVMRWIGERIAAVESSSHA